MVVKRMTYLASIVMAFGAVLTLTVQHSLAAPLATPTSDPVSVCTWLGCKPGALSYTQDDGLTTCQAPLEAAGFRGTFYYNGTDTLAWFTTISGNGHEVGSHLTNHLQNCTMPAPSCEPDCTLADLRSQSYTQQEIDDFRENQIDLNVLAIESGSGQPVMSMAYPCGNTGTARMIASEQYFLGARGYYDQWDGADFPWITYTNAAVLPDAMLINSDDGGHDVELINDAINQGRWAIFTMHDTCLSIANIVDNQADLWVAPVGEVLKYINVRDAFRFGSYVQTYNSISFEAGHSLSTMTRETYTGTTLLPVVFDNPITLVADLPVDNGVGSVTIDGAPVTFAITGSITGTHSVYFTTSLAITRSVAIQLTGPTSVQLRDMSVRSDTDLGENLGWLFAMLVLGAGGLAGLLKVSRQHPHHPVVREQPKLATANRRQSR